MSLDVNVLQQCIELCTACNEGFGFWADCDHHDSKIEAKLATFQENFGIVGLHEEAMKCVLTRNGNVKSCSRSQQQNSMESHL